MLRFEPMAIGKILNAYFVISFFVFSVNKIGLGPPSQEVGVTTKEEVPSGAPLSIRAEAVSATEILVSWKVGKRNVVCTGCSLNIVFFP